MRFCTTHRACETEGDNCTVATTVSAASKSYALFPCTLVDALIVTKEDGRWPKWAVDILRYDVAALAEAGAEEILDALERAEP